MTARMSVVLPVSGVQHGGGESLRQAPPDPGAHLLLYVYETHLVDGKPRPVMLAYLGKADAALTRLQGATASEEIRTFAHGAVAVMLSLADRLGVAAMIDRAARAPRKGAPERKGPSVGETLVLGAIGLAVEPTSKRGFASWATTTTLPILVGFEAERPTSQYFWDQMDRVGERALEGIGAEFARRVIEFADIELDTLFYDSTNYYTFIDSANGRCDVARRGNSKQKRSDLRQVNVGLLVARDGWLPLRHDIYRGNQNDVSRFPDALDGMRERLAALAVSPDDVTLVCDKGNISRANWPRLDATGLHHGTHHWTTQKLAVHTFMAVLAYTFMALIRKHARMLGFVENASTLVEILDGIRLARLRQVRSGPGRRSIRWQPEETDDRAATLYRAMVSPEHDLGSITRGRVTRTARTG
jgi:hypothetical protein